MLFLYCHLSILCIKIMLLEYLFVYLQYICQIDKKGENASEMDWFRIKWRSNGIFQTSCDFLTIISFIRSQTRSFKMSTKREFENLQLSCSFLLLIHTFDLPCRSFKKSLRAGNELPCNKFLLRISFVKFLIKRRCISIFIGSLGLDFKTWRCD